MGDESNQEMNNRTFLHELAGPMTIIRLHTKNLIRIEKGEMPMSRPDLRLELLGKILAACEDMMSLHADQKSKITIGKAG